jgi:hypothetical protein
VTRRGRRSRSIAAVLVGTTLLLGSACGDEPEQFGASKVTPFDASIVPSELLGLRVAPEEIGGAKDVKDPFVDGVGLYSLREGELLQGTLQVSRFAEDADYKTSRFRQSVVQQIGSTVPKLYRMGGRPVYLTAGKRQSIAVWFEGRYFFVLSMREEFTRPRALLREALEIKP